MFPGVVSRFEKQNKFKKKFDSLFVCASANMRLFYQTQISNLSATKSDFVRHRLFPDGKVMVQKRRMSTNAG